jgi:ADP-heptose:LPS heptosyltransferase
MKKKIELFFKSLFLKVLVGSVKKHSGEPLPAITPQTKVLFVRLNRIGDALVTTPLLAQIKEKTGCSIDVLADEKNYFVFQNLPVRRNVYVYRKGLKPLRELLKVLQQQEYDIVVDAHDDVSFTASLIIRLIPAPYKFALRKENEQLFTHTIEKPNSERVHVVERILQLAQLFGCMPEYATAHVVYEPSANAKQKAAEFIAKRFPGKQFIVGINISAGSEARFWGRERYRKLVSDLRAQGYAVMLLSTTRDLKHAFMIYDERDKIYYTPKFDEFVAIMEHLSVLFSPDTSTVHLASIYRVPVFGIYVQYNTEDMIWSPYGSDFDGVVTREANLANMTYEEVYPKFLQFLERHQNKAALPTEKPSASFSTGD